VKSCDKHDRILVTDQVDAVVLAEAEHGVAVEALKNSNEEVSLIVERWSRRRVGPSHKVIAFLIHVVICCEATSCRLLLERVKFL